LKNVFLRSSEASNLFLASIGYGYEAVTDASEGKVDVEEDEMRMR
jgi:hypothetical protein